jgi:Flp pilus assembly protein TadB
MNRMRDLWRARFPLGAVSPAVPRPYLAGMTAVSGEVPGSVVGSAFIIANVDRAGSHLVIVGVLVVVAAVAALGYWLTRAVKKRAERTRDEAPEVGDGTEAQG